MGSVAMSPYHSQPMAYHPQHQMAYPPQQPTFNQQATFPQQPNQQQAFNPQASMQMPPQQMPGQARQFQNAVAIPNLGMGAAPVDCPTCGQRAMTNISYHAGNTTQ
jgi:lipopolysaccharide-induced tumor necrosis factor-alpha factor